MAGYEVVVGNIGTVYRGSDPVEAILEFDDYADQARHGYGRAAGESVTLFENGEVTKEYTPPPTLAPDLERTLVAAVKAHAEEHYNTAGWDYVVECYTDAEIAGVLRRYQLLTVEAAIAEFAQRAGLFDERRREVEAERF